MLYGAGALKAEVSGCEAGAPSAGWKENQVT